MSFALSARFLPPSTPAAVILNARFEKGKSQMVSWIDVKDGNGTTTHLQFSLVASERLDHRVGKADFLSLQVKLLFEIANVVEG